MDIVSLVESFGGVKSQSDDLKKQADGYNKELKEYFKQFNATEAFSEHYRVKYSVAVQRGFDEEKLLAKLKELGATDCIKTVEVVDMNNLENAIYNKRIDAAALADCETVKEVEKINLYKNKEAK